MVVRVPGVNHKERERPRADNNSGVHRVRATSEPPPPCLHLHSLRGAPAKRPNPLRQLHARPMVYSDEKVANRNARRQKMPLERWTNPEFARHTCTCEYGLPSCREKSAGVAKRPRERSRTQNPSIFRNFCIAVRRRSATLGRQPVASPKPVQSGVRHREPHVLRVRRWPAHARPFTCTG